MTCYSVEFHQMFLILYQWNNMTFYFCTRRYLKSVKQTRKQLSALLFHWKKRDQHIIDLCLYSTMTVAVSGERGSRVINSNGAFNHFLLLLVNDCFSVLYKDSVHEKIYFRIGNLFVCLFRWIYFVVLLLYFDDDALIIEEGLKRANLFWKVIKHFHCSFFSFCHLFTSFKFMERFVFCAYKRKPHQTNLLTCLS